MIKNFYLLLVAFFAAGLVSCSDHNFDWESAHNQNPVTRYESMFTSVFGNIDPNQNWDFTVGKNVLTTRAETSEIKTGADLAKGTVNNAASSANGAIHTVGDSGREGNTLPNPTSYANKYTLVSNGNFLLCPVWHGYCGNYSLVVSGFDAAGRQVGDVYVISADQLRDAMNYNTVTSNIDGIPTNGTKCAPIPFVIPYPAGTEVHLNLLMDGATEVIPYESTDENGVTKYSSLMATRTFGSLGGSNVIKNQYYGVIIFDDASTGTGDVRKTGANLGTGSSACGDYDYNDLVLLVASVDGELPPVIESEDRYQENNKRYMVEDMGYYSDNIAASDIDFNDIVVDFHQKNKYEVRTTITSSFVTTEVIPLGIIEQDITVWAMGGTWDFVFGLCDVTNGEMTPIFQKGASSTTPDPDGYYVEFNPQYTLGDVPISSLNVRTMYNTGLLTDRNGDGNPNGTPQWICKIKKSVDGVDKFIDGWVEIQNNVFFEVLGGYNSLADDNNVYFKDPLLLEFPDEGDVPRIIAFPTTKTWRSEKVAIDEEWLNN